MASRMRTRGLSTVFNARVSVRARSTEVKLNLSRTISSAISFAPIYNCIGCTVADYENLRVYL